MSPFLQTLQSLAPEILLIGVACLQFLIGPFLFTEGQPVSRRVGRGWAVVSLLALVGAILVWRWLPSSSRPTVVHVDALPAFGRGVSILAGIVLVLINWDEVSDTMSAEFQAVLLLIVAGVSLTAAANDLIVLFLALELVSIPTYVFLYLPRREATNPEATIKYFLLSIVSS